MSNIVVGITLTVTCTYCDKPLIWHSELVDNVNLHVDVEAPNHGCEANPHE